MRKGRKDGMKSLSRRHSHGIGGVELANEQIDMVFLNSPSVVLESHNREQTMESKGQPFNTECTERTTGSKDKAVTSIAAQVSMKQAEIGTDKRKGLPKNKTKEHKYGLSCATWGVALRKPSRERKKVRAYSPSRERTVSKRAKLGLGKAGKFDAKKKYKSKGGQLKKEDSGVSKENSTVAGNGITSKCESISEKTRDKLSGPKGYSDELKHFMEEEVKRQILDQLGEACQSAEIEAIEVEDIGRDNGSHIHEEQDLVLLDHHYMAKTKLKVTVLLPVTVRAGEGPPQDLPKPMEADTQPAPRPEGDIHGIEAKKAALMEDTDEVDIQPAARPEPTIGDVSQRDGVEAKKADLMEDTDDSKGPEFAGDIREPESGRGQKEYNTREPETRRGSDSRESEPETRRGLMEPEKFDDEPQLESDCSEGIEVPESEFYDFLCDRSADKFSSGQVWAIYDNKKDVMPRDYMRIERVASVYPFKLEITLLQPRGGASASWVTAGNALACGEFCSDNRLRAMDQIDWFSHLANCEKGPNDIIYIYPAEREVWALFKDWNELDPNRRIRSGFEIVQIVSVERKDSVSVVPLVNFKSRTVFVRQREVEPGKIHKKDFIRFSHRIPTYEILDLEGCMELDPAAMPQ